MQGWRPKVGNFGKSTLWYSLIGIITIILLFPLGWMIISSFKPNVEIFRFPPKFLPVHPTVEAYTRFFHDSRYIRYFLNSYIISLAVTFLCVGLASTAAYGFSRFRIVGKRFLLLGSLALLLLPPVGLIIPYFILARRIHLLNTYTILIFADSSFTLPFSIWLLKSYLDSIPVEMEEAAMIEGCTRLQVFWYIVMPLTLPGVFATGTWVFLNVWNEYTFAVTLTMTPDMFPIPVGIAGFLGQFAMNWTGILAMATLASLPLMCLYVFLQKYVVQGLTAGAIK